MDGHFARGQNYGLFNYFYNKIGTLKFSSRLDFGGKGRASHTKKKVTCFAAHFVSFSGGKVHKGCNQRGVDLFLFLEITPHVIMSCVTDTEVCIPLIKLLCFTEAKSGIFDLKRWTRPEKAGRMVTLLIGEINFIMLAFSIYKLQSSFRIGA